MTGTDWKESLPEPRRKAVLIWELFGRPMGADGIDMVQHALEKCTDEQISNTIRHIAECQQ